MGRRCDAGARRRLRRCSARSLVVLPAGQAGAEHRSPRHSCERHASAVVGRSRSPASSRSAGATAASVHDEHASVHGLPAVRHVVGRRQHIVDVGAGTVLVADLGWRAGWWPGRRRPSPRPITGGASEPTRSHDRRRSPDAGRRARRPGGTARPRLRRRRHRAPACAATCSAPAARCSARCAPRASVTSDVAPAVPTVPSKGAPHEGHVRRRRRVRGPGTWRAASVLAGPIPATPTVSCSSSTATGCSPCRSSSSPGGRLVRVARRWAPHVGGERTRRGRYSSRRGDVVVWERDGLVLHVRVRRAARRVRALSPSLDHGRSDPVEQVVDFVLGPFGWG